jgi:hypothetical protein
MTRRIFGILILASWLLCVTGCSSEVDIKKVAADREGYAGQTLQSKVVLVGTGSSGMYVLPLGVARGAEQKLNLPESLEKKVLDMERAVGPMGVVCIKYTVAKPVAAKKDGTPAGPLGELVDIWVP